MPRFCFEKSANFRLRGLRLHKFGNRHASHPERVRVSNDTSLSQTTLKLGHQSDDTIRINWDWGVRSSGYAI